MQVLYVIHTPSDPLTAVFQIALDDMAALRQRGHTASVWSPETFPSLGRHSARFLPILYPIVVAKRLLQGDTRPDLIVFHSYSGWVFHLSKRFSNHLRNIRSVVQFHGLEPLYHRAEVAARREAGQGSTLRFRLFHQVLMPVVLRWTCKQSTRVVCLNREEQRYLTAHRWSSEEKTLVQPNPVPANLLVPRAYPAAATRLVFVGQWLVRKGVASLAVAFANLARRHPDLTLLCAGTLATSAQVLSDFSEEAQRRVTVIPTFPRSDLPSLLAGSHIFVFPSHFEGASLALLEAMASGLPIVTTPVGAAPDLLRDQESALLVAAGNTPALENAIENLMYDQEKRTRLGRSAQLAASLLTRDRIDEGRVRFLEQVAQA